MTQIVLVIDNEDVVRHSLEDYLNDAGIHAESARTGEEALPRISGEGIDILIVDLRLPGMDGNEIIARANAIRPDLRFLIYTGSVNYEPPARVKNAGVREEHIFKKPADYGGIARAILRLRRETQPNHQDLR